MTSKELTDRWYADTSNRANLENLLRNPVMADALRILFVKATEPVAPPAATYDLIQYGALLGYTRNGYFEALKNLEDLSRTQPVRPPERKAWDNVPGGNT